MKRVRNECTVLLQQAPRDVLPPEDEEDGEDSRKLQRGSTRSVNAESSDAQRQQASDDKARVDAAIRDELNFLQAFC